MVSIRLIPMPKNRPASALATTCRVLLVFTFPTSYSPVQVRIGRVHFETPNTKNMISAATIRTNDNHHNGVRPGLSTTLTHRVPLHCAPPLPLTVKPTSYVPGSLTGSFVLGVKLLPHEAWPWSLVKAPDKPWACPLTNSPRAKSHEAFCTLTRQVPLVICLLYTSPSPRD